jgi:hypothetical protein
LRPLDSFDYRASESALRAFDRRRRVVFAAFWAQRLIPAYAQLSQLEKFGSVNLLQEVLDLAWFGSEAAEHRADFNRLLALAPELELRPILAYAAMHCVSATWSALATAYGDPSRPHWSDVSSAIDAVSSYGEVLRYFLLHRDHPGVLIVSKDPDPLGLRKDRIWLTEVRTLNWLLARLGEVTELDAELTNEIRERAIDDDVRRITDAIVELSLALKPHESA